MKTATRAKIISLIQQNKGLRPVEIVRKLGLSPQAIHRHLKALVSEGRIEPEGRSPKTRYFISGLPRLDSAERWCASQQSPIENPEEFICPTRDVFSARLPRLAGLVKYGLNTMDLPLVIACAGEIGNNCFDHNLGYWRDLPGCWLETQVTGGRLWLCIGDRGQGIFQSLRRVNPAIQDAQTALSTAFEKIISGRALENRGNGLKFVRNIVVANEGRGIACRSGSGEVNYGQLGGECRLELERLAADPVGTITLMLWRLK